MTTSNYLWCAIMFVLGQLLDFLWVQIPYYKNLWKTSNEEFSMKKFWKADWNVLMGTAVFGLILLIAADKVPELIFHKKIDYTFFPIIFAALGGFGVSIAMNKWGSTKKYIEDIIDKKTNIADNK